MNDHLKVIRFKAEAHPIEFLQTKSFIRDAGRVFSQDELNGFLNYIAANPEDGAKMPGTGGLRKVRWKAKGQGKSGGARVIYYFRDLNIPLLLLAVYSKGQTASLTVREMRSIEHKVNQIVEALCLRMERSSNRSA